MTKTRRGRLVLRGLGILLVIGGLYVACTTSYTLGTGIPVIVWMVGVVAAIVGTCRVKR